MKTRVWPVLVSAILIAPACAPKANAPADVQAITRAMDDYVKAINAEDVPGSTVMMTEATTLYEPHMPTLVGKDAIAAFHQAFFAGFDAKMTAPVTGVRVEGGLGVVQGTYEQTATPAAEGAAPITDSGRWTAAVHRDTDGSWKLDWMMGQSDRPLPGTTPAGDDERAIMEIQRAWPQAIQSRDAATLGRLLAPEWVERTGSQVTTRAQALAMLASDALAFESFAVTDLRVFVVGDVAIATSTAAVKGTQGGKPFSNSVRSTDVLARRDGGWVGVYTQNVPVAR